MTVDDQQARRERLSDNSKHLLDAIDDLHTLEEGKRAELVSTPPFHEIADEVQSMSRRIFAMASDEVEQADQLETTDVSLDDVGGSHLDGRERTSFREPGTPVGATAQTAARSLPATGRQRIGR